MKDGKLSDREIYRWVDQCWKRAVFEGWSSEAYYFYLVSVAVAYLLGDPQYWMQHP